MRNDGKRKGLGSGRGLGKGGGQGRNNGGGFGPVGFCECPKCHTKIEHKQGLSCTKIRCPKCGNLMIRDKLLEKRGKN